MAKYTVRQSVLDAALDEYAQWGFSLIEINDHTLELYFKDKKIATLDSTKVTELMVREGCKNYLASIIRSL